MNGAQPGDEAREQGRAVRPINSSPAVLLPLFAQRFCFGAYPSLSNQNPQPILEILRRAVAMLTCNLY